jgi:hypothetical protein
MKIKDQISIYNNNAKIEIKPYRCTLPESQDPKLIIYINDVAISEHVSYTAASEHLIHVVGTISYHGVMTTSDLVQYLAEDFISCDGITIEDLLSDEFGKSANYLGSEQWLVNGETLDDIDVKALIEDEFNTYDSEVLVNFFNQSMDSLVESNGDFFSFITS